MGILIQCRRDRVQSLKKLFLHRLPIQFPIIPEYPFPTTNEQSFILSKENVLICFALLRHINDKRYIYSFFISQRSNFGEKNKFGPLADYSELTHSQFKILHTWLKLLCVCPQHYETLPLTKIDHHLLLRTTLHAFWKLGYFHFNRL